MTQQTIGVTDAARMLGLDRKTIRRLLAIGALPTPLNLPIRKTLWSRQAMIDFLAGQNRRTA